MKTFLKIDLALQSILMMGLLTLDVLTAMNEDYVYIVLLAQLAVAVYLIASGASNFFAHGNFGRYRLYNLLAGVAYIGLFVLMLFFLGSNSWVLLIVFYMLLPQLLLGCYLWLTYLLLKEEQTIIDKSSILF